MVGLNDSTHRTLVTHRNSRNKTLRIPGWFICARLWDFCGIREAPASADQRLHLTESGV
jgi:hypothetical protein